MKYKNIFSIGNKSKFELSFYKTMFKPSFYLDKTKTYGHIFTLSFQFFCFDGFIKFCK